VEDLFTDLVVIIAAEGSLTTQQDVRDDTDGPNVDTTIILFVRGQLRRHVDRCAKDDVHLGGRVEESRKAEIGKLNE